MSASAQSANAPSRLDSLLGFLERDPGNAGLIAEAASAAFNEGRLDAASELIARARGLGPLPDDLRNLEGLVALAGQRFEDAAGVFEGLLTAHPQDPALRFNLAWCRAMLRDYAGAEGLIDESVVETSPRAARLKVECLHHLGRLDEALACGQAFAAKLSDPALMGELANLALDAEQPALARAWAAKAGNDPGGLAAAGALKLSESRIEEAQGLFDRALEQQPGNARALLGRGLALLAAGDAPAAADCLDRGAAGFKSHLGSWVAAGWAHFVAGEPAKARASFETALAQDDTFAEIHGGLAVLDITEGKLEDARRRTDTALRLDRACLSGALAKSMLAALQGDEATAGRIREIALNRPVAPGGKTIAQAMAEMGASIGRLRGKR
jgi:tetratricopeptide (TPR) repeat protein